MPRVEDKIFAQDGLADFFAGVAKIFEGAAEEFGLGEDGESGCTGSGERVCESNVIEGVADDAAGGGGWLEFGNDVDGLAREGGGKIAEWSCGGDTVFERGFGQYLLAVIDGGAARFEDAIEDGACVGWSLSGHWVILYGWLCGVKL